MCCQWIASSTDKWQIFHNTSLLQTDKVLETPVLQILPKLLSHSKNNIVKEAAWTISNITAGNVKQIQAIIDANILPYLCHILRHAEFKTQKETAWAITNFCNGGTPMQINALLSSGILPPFCDLLESSDVKTVVVVIDGLNNILEVCYVLCFKTVLLPVEKSPGCQFCINISFCYQNMEASFLCRKFWNQCLFVHYI